MVDVKLEPSWKSLLIEEFEKPYFAELIDFVKQEYKSGPVYPPGPLIFNAFEHCPVERVKVVIIGQDPYHGKGQANGLSFSVNKDVRFPPSLQNIFQELHEDLGKPIPETGDLSRWAEQGVLLLNATLTVQASNPASHQGKGWEEFTDAVITAVNEELDNVVFILWGAYAQRKAAQVDPKRHLIITSAHPSPFSANKGFFGSKPFSKTNEYLVAHGKEPIDW